MPTHLVNGIRTASRLRTIKLNGTSLTNSQGGTTHTSGTPFVYQFNTVGTQTLTATWNGQSHTLTLNVYEANFGAPLSVQSYLPRTWELGQLHKNLIIEADNRIGFAETTPNLSAPRRFSGKRSTEPGRAGNRPQALRR